jgi:hypothetical protein
VITDLGVFDFDEEGCMRVRSLHPTVTRTAVEEATGFQLVWPEEVPITEPAGKEELRLLREEIDPLGIRDLEMTPARERSPRIREIFAQENSIVAQAPSVGITAMG